ncbi:MAG TPA: 2-oxo acid dehydrogenase subunit E2, partial [Solirubrobacterales bacterium]|nr:2-oxo acid dehydrogenase subunit E2 [Solirubrobacterales bacterium]
MSEEVQAPTSPAGNKGESEFVEYSRARQSMSRRIAESKATIPHIYLQVEADVTALVRRRAA